MAPDLALVGAVSALLATDHDEVFVTHEPAYYLFGHGLIVSGENGVNPPVTITPVG
jgi:hypothetical protein